MFRTAELGRTVSKEEYHAQTPVLRAGLLETQQELRDSPFPVIIVFGGVDKGGKIEDDYRITGIPETFVVNKQGEISWHIPAPITDGGRTLRAEIDEALRG